MPAGGTPSHQALNRELGCAFRRMSTRGPLFTAGGAGTKVHSLATGCGQRGFQNGLRCPPSCLAFVSVGPQHAHSFAHTAKVDLPEVGSETLWAFATEASLEASCVLGCRLGGLMGLP